MAIVANRNLANVEILPGYRLLDRLGVGGFGEVWRCEAPGGLNKAIKLVHGLIIKDDASHNKDRACQELRALSRVRELRHPFILSVERFDIIDGQLIIVMELADRDLDHRLQTCQSRGLVGIPRQELLKYAIEIADALDFMNLQHDLQHLDIKPQNLFLFGTHIKVADFGLVKDLEGFSARVTGGITPIYAPPETFDGWASRNSDQYSFAIVLCEMLTGSRPFNGPTARQFMMQHMLAEPDLSMLPERDRPIFARALDKDPNKRYASCTEFVELLLTATGALSSSQSHMIAANSASIRSLGEHSSQLLESILADPAEPPASVSASQSTQADGSMSATCSDVEELSEWETKFSAWRFNENLLNGTFNGTTTPTLVIGIGEIGLRVLKSLDSQLQQQFGGQEQHPWIRLLPIDCDPSVAQSVDQLSTSPILSSIQLCRLRKPNAYFRAWDNLRHLSGWLDANALFQIAPNGATNGFRPLGRLAFFDHYKKLHARLNRELSELAKSPAVEASRGEANTPQPYRYRPRVLIVTGMGGGLGSGMLIDMAHLVKRVLLEAGDEKPDVEAVLVASVRRNGKQAQQHRLNHMALAQNLVDFSHASARSHAKYEQESIPLAGIGLRAVYVVNGDDDSALSVTRQGVEKACDSIVQFVNAVAHSELGVQLDRKELTNQLATFRTIDWTDIEFPRELVQSRMACRLADRMLARWLAPPPADEVRIPPIEINSALESREFSTTNLANWLHDASNRRLKEPVESSLAKVLFKMVQWGRSSRDVGDFRFKVMLAELDLLLGLNQATEVLARNQLSRALTEVRSYIVPLFVEKIAKALEVTFNQRGARFDSFLFGIKHVLRLLDQRISSETGDVKAIIQAYEVASKDAREAVSMAETAQRRSDVPIIMQLVERYAETGLDFLLMGHLQLVIREVRARIEAMKNEVERAKAQATEIRKQLASKLTTELGIKSLAQEMIFPNGVDSCMQLEKQLLNTLGDDVWDDFETLAETKLNNNDGVWRWIKGVTSTEEAARRAGQLGSLLGEEYSKHLPPNAQLQTLLDQLVRPGSQSASNPPAGARSADKVGKLTFVSFPGRSPAGNIAPPIPAGDDRCFEVNQHSDKLMACQISTSTELKDVLPEWILAAKTEYEEACRSRMSPDVFPDLSR